MRLKATFFCLLLCLLAGGCSHFDGGRVRREHAEKFTSGISSKTAAELPPGRAVGLSECVRIALANNLDVQTAEINRRLAGLDRNIAFSNFLPHVNIELTAYSSNEQQALDAGGGYYMSTSDRSVMKTVLSVQQSIFMPETWFLYDIYTRGEDVSEFVARRTGDLIRLNVTMLYFACLSQEESRHALEASLEQCRTLLKEVEALARESLVMPSSVEQVRTLLVAQEVGLAENARMQKQTRAALLDVMGLYPGADIVLKPETPLTVPDDGLADQILYALLHRDELHIADRMIETRKDESRIAIAQFLPKLAGFANLTNSTDSYLKYENLLTYGVSAVLSVFDGFANVNRYKAARQREKQAYIDRERKCLQVMLEVIRARMQYDQALDQQRVAQQDLVAAQLLMRETEARWREGLLTASERLDAITRSTAAAANVRAAGFKVQVTAATLLDVTGMSRGGGNREKIK